MKRAICGLVVASGLSGAVARSRSAVLPGEAPFDLPTLVFRWHDGSLEGHRRLGEAMGRRFAEGARQRFEEWDTLQKTLLPSLSTPVGRALCDGFLQVHGEAFPEYIEELKGLATGSGLPFEWLFLGQIEEEFGGQLEGHLEGRQRRHPDHCSDFMLCTAERCIDAHNEDNDANSINRTFILDAQLGGPENRFLAFVYMGELATGAFGVNARGVGFSLNWVGPPPAARPGLGRGFVSRSMLDAKSFDDAVARGTREGQAGGHNIQFFDFCDRRIVNVEVAQERLAKRPIGEVPFYHANQYQTLVVPNETFTLSSVHRLAKVKQLPAPRDMQDMLRILGDQSDQDYPIFHDELSHSLGEKSDWTLATVAFDLDAKSATIMQGNPSKGHVHSKWDVARLVSDASGCRATTLFA